MRAHHPQTEGRVEVLMMEIAAVLGALAVGVGALRMKDLIRRGRLHRRAEQLASHGALPVLPAGRVPCPECAEAILPAARRCPFCRSVITPQL
ncbi:MAG: hypothetical protein M3Z10_01180 [Gemmatimonadota bacterium]|nr:hypothetical protein [Gemmatimonadota bacterium]